MLREKDLGHRAPVRRTTAAPDVRPSPHEGPSHHPRLSQEPGRLRADARPPDRGRLSAGRAAPRTPSASSSTPARSSTARARSRCRPILELAQLKERGRCRALIVTGCLTQRYGGDIMKEMPEIDGILGTSNLPAIVDLVRQAAGRHDWATAAPPGYLYDATTPRLLTAKVPYAYVKIAEGCDMGCTFCAIPQFRGKPPQPPARRHRRARWRGWPRAACRRRSSSPRTRSPTGATCRATATSATCCSRSATRACRGSGRCTCTPPTSTTGWSSDVGARARRAVPRHADPARRRRRS